MQLCGEFEEHFWFGWSAEGGEELFPSKALVGPPVQACQQTKNLQWLSHGLSTAVFEALALQTVGNVPLNNKLYALSIGFTFVRGGWLQF